jgi:hypothetical protein
MKSARLVPGHAPIYSKEAAVRGNVICFATHSYCRAGFALMGEGNALRCVFQKSALPWSGFSA